MEEDDFDDFAAQVGIDVGAVKCELCYALIRPGDVDLRRNEDTLELFFTRPESCQFHPTKPTPFWQREFGELPRKCEIFRLCAKKVLKAMERG
jgi:hypothetical protein